MVMEGHKLSDFYRSKSDGYKKRMDRCHPQNSQNVNYTLLNNKDGKYAWRPFQLIHPALYVSLVHNITKPENWQLITDCFMDFGNDPKIKCVSIPMESSSVLSDKAFTITNWWQDVEQGSIELSLHFGHVIHLDLSDCYGSILTSSIPSAIYNHGIDYLPTYTRNTIGYVIEDHIKDMSNGRGVGIPQGSVLMDFIAEIVLGAIDLKLSQELKRLNITDFQILRFRDDYRIFTNNPLEGEIIVRVLTVILSQTGMRLNATKTLISSDVVRDSIKPDKLYWKNAAKNANNLQDQLLLIHSLSHSYPNSGSLVKALTRFFGIIEDLKYTKQNVKVLIAIFTRNCFAKR